MNRGIVMEVHRRDIVVMTPGGEFLKYRKRQQEYHVGEEIVLPQEEEAPLRWQNRRVWQPALLLACSLLIAIAVLFTGREEKAAAYVAIDINPSLEASVDADLQVVALEAYNADGTRILQELTDWKGKPLQEVIGLIIRQSERDGYLQTKAVTLTYVAEGERVQKQLSRAFQAVQQRYTHIHITAQESTEAEREKAKQAGVTTGTYKKEHTPVPPAVPPAPEIEQAPEAEQVPETKLPPQPEPAPHTPSAEPPVPPQSKEQEKPGYKKQDDKDKEQNKGNGKEKEKDKEKDKNKDKGKEKHQEKENKKEHEEKENGKGHKKED